MSKLNGLTSLYLRSTAYHWLVLVLSPKCRNCSGTYVTGTLIGYTMQRITNIWIALTLAASMRPFFKMVTSCLMFNHTREVFELLQRSEDGFAPGLQGNDFAEASSSARQREEMAAYV